MIIRLDKFLANLKYGSRQEVKELIQAGHVKVFDKIIYDYTFKIKPAYTTVYLKDQKVFFKELIILALHKPKNYLSAHVDKAHDVVMSLIKDPYNRFDLNIAGRLDLDAEGLLILTNSGSLIHKITSPKSHIVKTYEVTLDKTFMHEVELLEGLMIFDDRNQLYFAQALDIKTHDKIVVIKIDQGKFHQVKRMFAKVGYNVINLKRIAIGKYHLKDLQAGSYIEIEEKDIL